MNQSLHIQTTVEPIVLLKALRAFKKQMPLADREAAGMAATASMVTRFALHKLAQYDETPESMPEPAVLAFLDTETESSGRSVSRRVRTRGSKIQQKAKEANLYTKSGIKASEESYAEAIKLIAYADDSGEDRLRAQNEKGRNDELSISPERMEELPAETEQGIVPTITQNDQSLPLDEMKILQVAEEFAFQQRQAGKMNLQEGVKYINETLELYRTKKKENPA